MQRLQYLLASSEEWIARRGDIPGRRECGQTGLQELARFLVIQAQVPGQLEDHCLAFGQEVSLFPANDRTPMDSNETSKLLLCEVPAFAQRLGVHQRMKNRTLSRPFICSPCELLLRSRNVASIATLFILH
jgi:hypothetical protein